MTIRTAVVGSDAMRMTGIEKRFVNDIGHSRRVAEAAVRRLRHVPVHRELVVPGRRLRQRRRRPAGRRDVRPSRRGRRCRPAADRAGARRGGRSSRGPLHGRGCDLPAVRGRTVRRRRHQQDHAPCAAMVIGARRDAASPQTAWLSGVRRPEGTLLAGVGPEAARRSRRRLHWSGSRPLLRVTAAGSRQAGWLHYEATLQKP